MRDLGSVWEAIDAESSPSGTIWRRIEPEWEYDLFLTQVRPSRERSLHASFNGPAGTSWKALRSSRGLGIAVSVSEGSAAIDITERDPRFSSIFEALITDVIAGLSAVRSLPATEKPLPLDFVAGRILRWQACLKTGADGLSDQKQAGLFGELFTLRQLIDHGVPAQAAVAAWTGPSAAVQDFQHAGLSIEVKASRQTQPVAVTISSERQLDTTAMSRLFLLHFALEPRTDGAGETLPQIVHAVRQAVGHESHAGLALDDCLIEYGYLDVHALRYENLSYTLRFLDAFDVVEGFPRIVEADLPDGIGDLSYVLALSACEPFRIDPTEVWKQIGEKSK